MAMRRAIQARPPDRRRDYLPTETAARPPDSAARNPAA
jgi:hypothetical protein